MKIARIVLRQRPCDDLITELRRRRSQYSARSIANGKDIVARSRIAGCKLGGELELRQTCLIPRDGTRQVSGPQAELAVMQGGRSVVGLVDQDSRRYCSRGGV